MDNEVSKTFVKEIECRQRGVTSKPSKNCTVPHIRFRSKNCAYK